MTSRSLQSVRTASVIRPHISVWGIHAPNMYGQHFFLSAPQQVLVTFEQRSKPLILRPSRSVGLGATLSSRAKGLFSPDECNIRQSLPGILESPTQHFNRY